MTSKHVVKGAFALSSLFISLSGAAFAADAAGGKVFNPDTSVNFLGLMQHGTGVSNDRTSPDHNGILLQEAELQFFADVDPYLRANALLSIAQEDGGTGYGIDPEEVFLETIDLPVVTLRAGKMKLALGKHNTLHTHAFPFIDAPLVNQRLLGDEGLNETGVSAAALLPFAWFSEFTLQGFSETNEDLFSISGASPSDVPPSGRVGGLMNWRNLWDLSDDLTYELAAYGTRGKNAMNAFSTVWGADSIFKWRPSEGGKYHALVWASEYLNGNRRGLVDGTSGENIARLGGWASWLQYQFAERWWIQARAEKAGTPHSDALPTSRKYSALLGFFPSEFSGFRLQYDRQKDSDRERTDHTLALQFNVTIGAHPAHSY